MTVRERVKAAANAAHTLSSMSGGARSETLRALSRALADPANRARLHDANREDLALANEAAARGELASALVKRLGLTDAKLDGLCDGLRQLADAPEIVGAVRERRALDEGLVLERRSCPLGTIGVVFEARPDAVPQITGLAIKSGNAVVLKGGSESLHSNRALVSLIHGVLSEHGVDPRCVLLLEDRAEFQALLDLGDSVDIVIARGSSKFVEMVRSRTSIPVMGHAEGLCHLYLHRDADAGMATAIAVDAKCSYPAACNTIETLLWHVEAADTAEAVLRALISEGVELRGCAETRAAHPAIAMNETSSEDWDTEYCGPVLSVRRVDDLDAAIAHIARHGSKHTDAIVTTDESAATTFVEQVDSACVFVNASTRFADGYRFGLGAEVGISTGKLHARGPVGVEGLLTHRWILRGQGQCSTDYGPGKRAFLHRDL